MQNVHHFTIDGSLVPVKLEGTTGFEAEIPKTFNRIDFLKRLEAALPSDQPGDVAILAAFKACE